MKYTIKIGDSFEVEACDQTSALISLKHYIKIHPDKKITLIYNGDKNANPTASKS
jgi:hypothetical protein